MRQNNNSVILVEDNISLREALEHHLVDAGFSIRGVGDGQELNQELAISKPDVIVLDLNLPEEDGIFNDRSRVSVTGAVSQTLAVIAYPRISNLDEFQPLHNVPGVRLMWARHPVDLAGMQAADWIILPGSKNTSADLAWLRQQGLDAAVARHAAQGGAVLGICGGLQMLGEALIDTHGIDGNAPGLGLMPLVTQFAPDKTVTKTAAQFGPVSGPWSALSGVHLAGYEIHHGQTQGHSAMLAGGAVLHEVIPGLAWQNGGGQVMGTYLHGMFESPAVLQALFGAQVPTLETVFDGLADFIEQHFEAGFLRSLLEPAHRV
jgi:adenosylcobyric acid synthase